MERELKKISAGAAPEKLNSRTRLPDAALESDPAEVSRKMRHFLDVAKGEIHRLDYIVSQFL